MTFSLREMAVAAGAQPIETHDDRLMVLASVPQSDLLNVVEAMPKESMPGWMSTFSRIGALDLATMLESASDTAEAQKAVTQWKANSRIFLRMVPAASTDFTKKHAPKVGVVEACSNTRAEFLMATHRLAAQSAQLRGNSFMLLPPIDSEAALEDPLVRELSHWAAVACMLGMPEALRPLLDAFPEAMSTSVAISVPVLEVLSSNQDANDLMGMSSPAHQQVSPFLCALHASSVECMQAISEKRAVLELPGDPPAIVIDVSKNKVAMTWGQCFHGVNVSSTPQAYAHAMRTAIDGLAAPDKTVTERLMAVGLKNVAYFEACHRAELFKNASPKDKAEALFIALMNVPDLLPDMLKAVPWAAIHKRIGTEKSIVLRLANATAWKGKSNTLQAAREHALAQLITQAEKDSKTEILLSTFIEESARPTCLEPVSTLSQRGWTDTLKAFFDHGVNPKTSPREGMFSLLALANQQNHPSFPMIKSYLARGRAFEVLDEIASSGLQP